MRLHPSFLIALLCALSTNVYAQETSFRTRIYACTTADGRKLTADQPIKECANREQRIIGRSGAVIAIIPPKLTPRQETLLLEEKTRQQEILKKEQEQREIEQQYIRTLLERYPTPQAYALAHQNATKSLVDKMEEVKTKRTNLLKQQQDLKVERDSYADAKKIPIELTKSSQTVDNDIIVQDRVLEGLNEQIKKVDATFEADKQVLLPYWKKNQVTP